MGDSPLGEEPWGCVPWGLAPLPNGIAKCAQLVPRKDAFLDIETRFLSLFRNLVLHHLDFSENF